jgi:hypothetical protein
MFIEKGFSYPEFLGLFLDFYTNFAKAARSSADNDINFYG